MKRIANSENIAFLDLFYERWLLLKKPEPYWSQKICMLEGLIERLENTVPVDVDKVFFAPSAERMPFETPPDIVWPATTAVVLSIGPRQVFHSKIKTIMFGLL